MSKFICQQVEAAGQRGVLQSRMVDTARSIDNSIQVSRSFTLIASAASNLAFSGRTPEIQIKEGVHNARNGPLACLLLSTCSVYNKCPEWVGSSHREVTAAAVAEAGRRMRTAAASRNPSDEVVALARLAAWHRRAKQASEGARTIHVFCTEVLLNLVLNLVTKT
jgi:hypothetical protein